MKTAENCFFLRLLSQCQFRFFFLVWLLNVIQFASETLGVFRLPEISGNLAGNFHRVKNLFHFTQVPFIPRLHSRAILRAKIDDSLELVKLVNGTQISIGKVSNGKTGLPFQLSLLPKIFHCNNTKSPVIFTFQTEFPESFDKWKTPLVY